MKKIIVFLLLTTHIYTQTSPKLVVGIVIDQMRADFLTRYSKNYTKGGFNRLKKEGFWSKNMHYNYCPTYTGPGHTSIYTGSVPAIHGIVANNWYNNSKVPMYCAQDDSVKSIGAENTNGLMSPKNLKTTTIADQLKLSNISKSKVFGVCIKDRGAIFPAGKMADGAFWYDKKSGNFITSSYYMDKLPKYVEQFNEKKFHKELLKNGWNKLLKDYNYSNSDKDSASWEEELGNENRSFFPYTFNIEKSESNIVKTPFGNTLTTMMAKEILINENLGNSENTDMLVISYSCTDIIGHASGPYSVEVEDTYLRLDREIEEMLNLLDNKLGKDNYVVFLTADHGVQDVPAYSNSKKIDGEALDYKDLLSKFNSTLAKKFKSEKIISYFYNENLFLNSEIPNDQRPSIKEICNILNEEYSTKINGIRGFYSLENISEAAIQNDIKEKINNGFYPNRSGQIYVLLDPNFMTHNKKGTTHGSPYSHDTHVPFLLMGKGIVAKQTSVKYDIIDIAPTITIYLDILQPNGNVGKVIEEVFKN